jgi:hypothetical protein
MDSDSDSTDKGPTIEDGDYYGRSTTCLSSCSSSCADYLDIVWVCRSPYQPTIHRWKWCHYRPRSDNKKLDFKVTSSELRASNNTRSSSIIAFDDPGYGPLFGEVFFFFTAHLPGDLSTIPGTLPVSSDTSDDKGGTTVYQLACIQEFSTDSGGGNSGLLRRTGAGGPRRVIAIDAIVELAGIMRSNGSEYLTTRFTSLLFDSNP